MTTAPPADAAQSRIAIRIAEELPWLLLPPGMRCKYVERPAVAAVPNVKPWMAGAFAERGTIAPVFDLARWLDSASSARGGGLVMLSDDAAPVAFLSVRTPEVVSVGPADVVAADAAPADIGAPPAALQAFLDTHYRVQHRHYAEFRPLDWVRAHAAQVPNAT